MAARSRSYSPCGSTTRAVADWRIFYAIDRSERLVDIHAVVHKNALKQ